MPDFERVEKMAKQRRTNTSVSAITNLLGAIEKVAEAELGDNLTPDQQTEANKIGLAAVKEATATIGDSNVMTAMENSDDAIEAQHQAAEAAEAEEHLAEVEEADAAQDAIEQADAEQRAAEEAEEQPEG